MNAASARHREYMIERRCREWTIELIESQNQTWSDLFEQLVREVGYAW